MKMMRQVRAWRGKAWMGEARCALAGPGGVRFGLARQGQVAKKINSGPGKVRAWRGKAWLGGARQGSDGHG
jgi:hypothetical protein